MVAAIPGINVYKYMCMIIYIVADGCPEETDPDYGIAWPSVMVNTNATNNCLNATGMAKQFNVSTCMHV